METEHEEDLNKQCSEDKSLEETKNVDVEFRKIHSEETGNVIIDSETHSRSSSSSSSSSSPSNDLEVSPTDSPPVQVMERDNNNEGDQVLNYDPNRIPSSVFERSKSNIPAEWSCNSNESLFSIHLGGNSFTVDLMKSGELLAYSPAFPMPPPPGGESKPFKESSKVDDSEVEVVEAEEKHKEEEDNRESHEKEEHPVVSWKTPTTSYRSNRSSSTHSFSFPILARAASESANGETEEHKKQAKQSQDLKLKAEAANKNKQQTMCRCFSCFHSCPWCCSHSSCSCF